MNRTSSCDAPIRFDVDLLGFLAISRLWQLSYEHSWIAYADETPAGLMLNTVDSEDRQAYSFYLGVLPEFRRFGLSKELFDSFLTKVRRENYVAAHTETMSPIALSICTHLGYEAVHEALDMEFAIAPWGPPNARYDFRAVSPAQIFAEWSGPDPPFRSWKTRRRSLAAAGSMLQTFAAYRDSRPEAYVIAGNWPNQTAILDLQFHPGCETAALAALAFLAAQGSRPPFIVYDLLLESEQHRLLAKAGSSLVRRTTILTLSLAAPENGDCRA
jgi:GNAT superfamily N-acetyltransferase